jgi:predicted phosphodiesterase
METKILGSITQKLLVFGGPYSNLAATMALRARADELDIPAERIICTGDIVAYCAEPEQTLELIRQWGIHVVMGNCEEALAFSEPDCGCGFEADSSCSALAITWYEYADSRVSVEQRRWMQDLSRSIEFEVAGKDFKVVHGSLSSINEFVFSSSDAPDKLEQIRNAGVDAIIGGHCGIPFGQGIDELFWLNAGVIGMPANDGGSHGWYMLIDPIVDGARVSWHRLDYDHTTSRRTTIAAGMAEYGQALLDGRWPNIDILPATESDQSGQPLNLPPLHIINGVRLD